MTLIAMTDIKHGEQDGSVVRVAAGEEVDEGLFDEEVLVQLREADAVKDLSEVIPLGLGQEHVERLEAELAQAKALLAENGVDLDEELVPETGDFDGPA